MDNFGFLNSNEEKSMKKSGNSSEKFAKFQQKSSNGSATDIKG